MSRYRKIEVAMWTDAKFASLSAAQPNAQTLWFYLLCGPRTLAIPGLVVAKEEVIASDLGWTVKAFREVFAEVFAKGMAKADWPSGLVVLERALVDSTLEPRETSRPTSPNVVKSWASQWDLVPESSLKDEYLMRLDAFCEALGEAFRKAFREAFRKAMLKATAQPSRNQEQDTGAGSRIQEQEGSAPAKPSRARKDFGHPIPADWVPSDEHADQCTKHRLDLAYESTQFRNNAVAKALRYTVWNSAFSTWLTNSAKWAKERRQPPARTGRAEPASNEAHEADVGRAF